MATPTKPGSGSKLPRSPRPPGRRPFIKKDQRPADPGPPREIPGLAARRLAVRLIDAVLRERVPLPRNAPQLTGNEATIEPRDRAFAHLIALSVIRRHGSLSAVLDRFIERPLPPESGRTRSILLAAAAQILLLATPPHAAINLAVEQCRRDHAARRFDKLANAVLRRVAERGPAILATLDSADLDIPAWLLERWISAYGTTVARRIAAACLVEAPLDLSVKSDPAAWAEKLGGRALPTGSVRVSQAGRVEDLDGYADGSWWVQDVAASLPARLLGDVAGRRVADLCAAPGGKTAQLAAAGARVVAVDPDSRLALVRRNLERLQLSAAVEVVRADLETWQPAELFDAVLLDAPCSATGTIRRHPDILHLKQPEDIARSTAQQERLLDRAAALVRTGGLLVYCTCSLEPEESQHQIAGFLRRHPDFARAPVTAADAAIQTDWITPEGDLRTLPCFDPDPLDAGAGGMDGFFAARLRRTGS